MQNTQVTMYCAFTNFNPLHPRAPVIIKSFPVYPDTEEYHGKFELSSITGTRNIHQYVDVCEIVSSSVSLT